MHMRSTILAGSLAALAFAFPVSAGALATVEFTTNSGQFSVFDNEINFGNGLQVSFAEDDAGVVDDSIQEFDVVLDSVDLIPGSVSPTGEAGIFEVGVDDTQTYEMSILAGSGAALFTAEFDPGSFLTVGSIGNLSPGFTPSLTNRTLTAAGESSEALSDLVMGDEADFAVSLTSAGQDFAGRINGGFRVTGSASGAVATIGNVIPEPGTAALLLGGLGGLGLAGRHRRRA